MYETPDGLLKEESLASSRPGLDNPKKKGSVDALSDSQREADVTAKEVGEEVQSLSPEQLARVEDFLRTEGVILDEYVEKLGKKVKVVDLQRLIEDRSLNSKAFTNRVVRDGRAFNFSKRETLFQLLRGEEGLTPEQLARKEFVVKPFVYIPESVEAATSMTSIKNADFHAGMFSKQRVVASRTFARASSSVLPWL